MPIELKYGNPSGVIGAAYAAGQNRAEEKRRREAMRMIQQQQAMRYDTMRRFQEHQFGLERQNKAFEQRQLLQEQGQEFEAGQRRLDWDRRDELHQDSINSRTKLQENEFEFRHKQQQDQNRFAVDRDRQEGVRRGQYVYTPAQQAQLNKIDADIAEIGQSQQMSDDQKREAIDKLEERRRSIIPQPRPEQQPIPIGEQFENEVHWDEHGTPWVRDQHGTLHVPRGWKSPSDSSASRQTEFENRLKLTQAKTAYRQKLQNMTKQGMDGQKVPLYSPEQIDSMVNEQYGNLESLIGPEQSASTESPTRQRSGPSWLPQSNRPDVFDISDIRRDDSGNPILGIDGRPIGLDGQSIGPSSPFMALPRDPGVSSDGSFKDDLYRYGVNDRGTGPTVTDGLYRYGVNDQGTGPFISYEKGQPPRIRDDDDFRKLPSGTLFIAPDGTPRRKP